MRKSTSYEWLRHPASTNNKPNKAQAAGGRRAIGAYSCWQDGATNMMVWIAAPCNKRKALAKTGKRHVWRFIEKLVCNSRSQDYIERIAKKRERMMQGRQNAILDKKSGKILVQTPLPPFNCLALEGGGVACTSLAGAINKLEKFGVLDDVEYVSGISGGAIAAAAISLGYTAEESADIQTNMPIHKFMEQSESWFYTPWWASAIRKAVSVLRSPHFALSSGQVFLKWLQQLVKEKLGDENATFRDLEKKIAEELATKGTTKFKHLYIGVTCVSYGYAEPEVCSAETNADMPIAVAIAASGAYPFLFPPVIWKGRTYSDGGVKNVLLTKVFDDKRFLPKGYGFNEKGLNPGVLAVKVDTYEEIAQFIWGVKNEVEIVKASQYLWLIATATAHTNDMREIREGRMVLPLADADVDRLDLNLSPKMKSRLIAEAEQTTEDEFLQNHVNAVYSCAVYASVKAWLQAQTDENLKQIRKQYQELLSELEQKPEKAAAREQLPEYDPAKPTIAQLKKMIEFITSWLPLTQEEREGFNLEYPPFHINLKPDFKDQGWHGKVRAHMKEMLIKVKAKIEHAEARFVNLKALFAESLAECASMENPENKFHGHNEEKLQELAAYYEHLMRLCEMRDDLEVKLGKHCRHAVPDKKNSSEYEKLYSAMSVLGKDPKISPTIKAILMPTMPILSFQEREICDIDFQLDVRRPGDRRLYLVAAMIYVERRACWDKEKLLKLYQEFFPDQKAPSSTSELIHFLGMSGADLQIELFRLERMMQHFERMENPAAKPALDLDVVLGTSKFSFFATGKRQDSHEIEMKVVLGGGENESVAALPIVLGEKLREEDSSPPAEMRM